MIGSRRAKARALLDSLGRPGAPIVEDGAAARFVADAARRYRGDVTLMCVGVPTRAAAALAEGDTARALRRVIVVGGAWAPGPAGAPLPWVRAEPRFGADPAAAAAVMRAPALRLLVPPALARRLPIARADAPRHRALGDACNLDAARRIRRWLLWRRGAPAPALLAAVMLLTPEAFTLRTRAVEVAGKGFLREARGACATSVAEAVNVDLFRTVYWGAFAALAGWRTTR